MSPELPFFFLVFCLSEAGGRAKIVTIGETKLRGDGFGAMIRVQDIRLTGNLRVLLFFPLLILLIRCGQG